MSEQFFTGQIVEIYEADGMRMGKLRVGGALTRVALALLPEARVGDTVLVHAGVAVSKIESDKISPEKQG